MSNNYKNNNTTKKENLNIGNLLNKDSVWNKIKSYLIVYLIILLFFIFFLVLFLSINLSINMKILNLISNNTNTN